MWGGWVDDIANRLEASTGRALREGLYAMLGVDPETGLVYWHGLLAATPMARIREAVESYARRRRRRGGGPGGHRRRLARTGPGGARPARDGPAGIAAPSSGARRAVRGGHQRRPGTDGADARLAGHRRGDGGPRLRRRRDPEQAGAGSRAPHLRALGIEPDRTAVVGDSPADLRMGRAAGAGRVIAVLTGVGDEATLERRSRTPSFRRSGTRAGLIGPDRWRTRAAGRRPAPPDTLEPRYSIPIGPDRRPRTVPGDAGCIPAPWSDAKPDGPRCAARTGRRSAHAVRGCPRCGVDRDTVRGWCDSGDLWCRPWPQRRPCGCCGAISSDCWTSRSRPHPLNRATPATAGPVPRKAWPHRQRRTAWHRTNARGHPRDGGSRPGTDALRRLASGAVGSDAIQPVFEEVLDDSIRLFHADRAGLWLWHRAASIPLELVAGRDYPDLIAARRAATADSEARGLRGPPERGHRLP